MLYLDSPIGPINGLTVFRDHADDSLFYYMNERPRLARNDGVPEFVFLKYKRDITDNPSLTAEDKDRLGGGFLAFTVDLSVDDDVLKDAKQKLAAFASGTLDLTQAQFTKGTVRLSIDKDVAGQADAPAATTPGSAFFEEVLGTTEPSMIGDNRATFGVILSHEGATLLEAALQSGISPIGVIYDLEYLGLRPAFDVTIHADYHRIYTELDLQFGLKASYGPISAAVDIDLAWQKLRENGSITVQVKAFTDDADLRKQADAAFDWFKSQLLQDFFKTSLEPPMFAKQGQSGGLLGSLQSLLGPLSQTQAGPSTPTLGAPTTSAPTVAAPPQGANSGVTSLSDQNRAANASNPAAAGAGNRSATLGAAPGLGLQIGFSLKQINQDELKERDFEYSEQAAVTRNAAPQGLFSTMVSGLDLSRAVKEVDLDDDFFKRIDATFTLAADLGAEKIAAVNVNVEYPADRPAGVPPTQVGGFPFTAADTAAKEFQTFLDDHKNLAYRYKVAVDFGGDSDWEGEEPHFESDWTTTTANSVTVNPFEAFDRFDLEVLLGNDVATSSVAQVQVELIYEDTSAGFRADKTFTFGPTDGSKHWKLRFADTTQKTYRSRTTYFLPGNVRVQGEWVQSAPITVESDTLVVHSPFQNRIDLRVVPVLPPEFTEADMEVRYREDDTGYEFRQTVTFAGGTTAATQAVSIPTIAAAPQSATTTTTVVRADGSVFAGQPTPVADNVVVLSDGVGATHRVTVTLASEDLAAKGLVAVRVRLTGDGQHGDRDEAFFAAGTTSPQTVALVQPDDGAFAYVYEVIGYTTDGLPRSGATASESSLTLPVPLP